MGLSKSFIIKKNHQIKILVYSQINKQKLKKKCVFKLAFTKLKIN